MIENIWPVLYLKKVFPQLRIEYSMNKQKCIALNSFHFPIFVDEWDLWNPLWVSLKQTRANNCPPLPMRLLCLSVWSKTLYICDFLKKCIEKCIENEDIFCTTSARTIFYHSNLGIVLCGHLPFVFDFLHLGNSS